MSRFTLRAMLAGVAFVALAIVATMNANYAWAVAIEALVYLLLATAILGAIATTGERRMFWVGALVFGWGLWLAGALSGQVQLPGSRLENFVARVLAPVLNTEELVVDIQWVQREPNAQVLSEYVDNYSGARQYRVVDPDFLRHLTAVIRAMLVFVAGVIGGTLGAWFYRSSPRETAGVVSPP